MVFKLEHTLIFLLQDLKGNKFLWLLWLIKKKKNTLYISLGQFYSSICKSLKSNRYWQLPIGERQPLKIHLQFYIAKINIKPTGEV